MQPDEQAMGILFQERDFPVVIAQRCDATIISPIDELVARPCALALEIREQVVAIEVELNWPMSSPQIIRTLGFFCCALAAGGEAALNSVATVARARLIFPVHFMSTLLFLLFVTSRTNTHHSTAEYKAAAFSRRASLWNGILRPGAAALHEPGAGKCLLHPCQCAAKYFCNLLHK
jgi:hypothetical protein